MTRPIREKTELRLAESESSERQACNRLTRKEFDIIQVKSATAKAWVHWWSATVHSALGNPFVCNGPEVSTNFVTTLITVACVWHLRLQVGKLVPLDIIHCDS